MKLKKIIKLIVAIIMMVCLSSQLLSCFSYSEINKITFATSIIFDIDDMDNISVFIDCVRPYRSEKESSDKGKRVIFQSKGKTSLEAISKINNYSNNKINFSQVRAYIFSEEAAKKGLDKYINLINNSPEFGYKPNMFVYYGDVNEIVKPDSENDEQDYLGLYLEQLESINKKNMDAVNINVNEYIMQSLEGNKNALMASIELKEDIIEKKIAITGATLINDNKFAKKLTPQETKYLNLLNKNLKGGIFEIDNPNSKGSFISLDLVQSKQNTDISFKDDNLLVRKKIDLTLDISEIQGGLELDNNILEYIAINEKNILEKELLDFFSDYKKKDVDILEIKRLIYKKYPDKINEYYLDKTTLDVEVNVNIEGSNLVRNAY